MCDSFDYAIGFILDHEGGFQDDPDDSGNWTGGTCGLGELRGTKYGIAAASFPHEDIEALTLERAKELYRQNYWRPYMDQLDRRVAAKIFNIAVNCGVGTGAKILQRACRVKDDGVVGPVTLAAVAESDPAVLLDRICREQANYYHLIGSGRRAKFLKGWLARAAWTPPDVTA